MAIITLDKPLCILDIESTGLSVGEDRIVSLALLKILPDGSDSVLEIFCNPKIRMREEVIKIHGISNKQAATFKSFKEQAEEIHNYIQGCDLAGYNLVQFDVPMLYEEFYRAGIEWDLTGVQIIDAGNIFKKKEERTLSAALHFYCNRLHDGAHSALADVLATKDVLYAQTNHYEDLGGLSVGELAQYSNLDKLPRVDIAGYIRMDNNEYVYGLKSKEGIRIKDDIGFAKWMLQKDFPVNTKLHLNRILQGMHKERLF